MNKFRVDHHFYVTEYRCDSLKKLIYSLFVLYNIVVLYLSRNHNEQREMTDQCIAFNRLHYYSYLIMPHGVIDCVAEWQRRFVKMFGFRNATVKLPHLSFSNWSMSPHCERRLFDLLEARCRVVKPLNVKLTGFDDLNGGAFCFMVAQGKQCFDRVIDDKGKWRRDFKMVGGVPGVEFTENLHVKPPPAPGYGNQLPLF